MTQADRQFCSSVLHLKTSFKLNISMNHQTTIQFSEPKRMANEVTDLAPEKTNGSMRFVRWTRRMFFGPSAIVARSLGPIRLMSSQFMRQREHCSTASYTVPPHHRERRLEVSCWCWESPVAERLT